MMMEGRTANGSHGRRRVSRGTVTARLGILLLLLLAITPASAQQWRYPVPTAGGIGMITETGALVDAGPFDALKPFAGPVGPARSDGRWGYIDSDGTWVIEPAYRQADPFEGDCTTDPAEDCVARVLTEDGWHLIDREGRFVTGRAYSDLTPVGDGLAAFQGNSALTPRGQPGLWGVLSTDGREISDATLDGAARPAEGMVPAQRYRKMLFIKLEKRWGFVNSTGDWTIEPRYTSVRAFSEGVAMVSDGKRAIYLNPAGDSVLTVDYPAAHSFSDGLARVADDGGAGFIDRTGSVVVPLFFEAASDFSSGRAVVRQDGAWGYIDTAGEWVIEPRFEVAGSFEGPLARVVDGGREMYIDRNGQIVWTGR